MRNIISPQVIIIISIVIGFYSQLLFKEVSSKVLMEKFTVESILKLLDSLFKNENFWLALLVFIISSILWITGLRNLSLSRAFSFTSLNYILIATYSYYVIEEEFTFKKTLACIFIIMGILLINKKA